MNKNDGRDFADYVLSMRDCRSRIKELERMKSELEGLEPLINKTDSLLKRYKGLADETAGMISKRDYTKLKMKLTRLPDSIQSLEEVLDRLKGATAVEQQHIKRRTELLTFCAERMRSDDITKTIAQGQQLLQDIANAAAEAERARLEEIERRKQEEKRRRQEEQRLKQEAEARRILQEQAEMRERERMEREKNMRLNWVKRRRREVKEEQLKTMLRLLVTLALFFVGFLGLSPIFDYPKLLVGVCFVLGIFGFISFLEGLSDLSEAQENLKETELGI